MSADADTLRAMQLMLLSEVERLRADMQAMGDELAAAQADALMEQRGDFVAGEDGGVQVSFADHPWKLYQKPENDPGLTISMIPGIVTGTDASNSNPLNLIVTYADTAFPDDATTLVWVKVSIELIVWTSYFKVWAVSAAVVQTGASLPADTLDISTQTDGDVHVQIGSVTTAAGAVTSIVQSLSTPLVYNLPPILYGPATGVHVLGSDAGDLDWIATAEFTCPEEEE